jgi:site-specific DNA-cytosine methylase
MTTHTFGSLFAGVGGFDMGMEAAGWTCTWQVEWDKQCQQVLRYHWPDVPKYGDVSTVSGYDLAPVDCITFGSPCQDLSVAGKRAGLDGNRSGLFFEAVRIIKEMRDATGFVYPRWAIWENVVGALSSNHGHDFAAVLDSLAEAGAVAIEWAVLDAQHFGIPQRRRRVFVISCFDPATAARCPDPLLPVSESLRRDTSAKRTKGEATPRSAAYGLGADSGIAGTLGTFTGGFRTTDLDGVGAYVVNAPTDDVVFPIQDGRGMEKMQNGFGIGKPDDPMYTLDATGAQAVAVVSVVGSHSGTWEVVNVPTDDVVGTLSGGASRLIQRAGRLYGITHTRATGW